MYVCVCDCIKLCSLFWELNLIISIATNLYPPIPPSLRCYVNKLTQSRTYIRTCFMFTVVTH